MNNTLTKIDNMLSYLNKTLSEIQILRSDYLSDITDSKRKAIEYIINIWDEYLKFYKILSYPLKKDK